MHTSPTLALYWDESHLWGILLLRALQALHAPVTVLRAEEIRGGALDTLCPSMLLVPGGWARLKSLALDEDGRQAVRGYVQAGGHYLGFCGGAGLALASEGGTPFLDLCPWTRKPARDRLPNFSGHLRCAVQVEGMPQEAELPVWWPSQFAPTADMELEVLARYTAPGEDFWSADLEWSQIAPSETKPWEELYGINLDPDLLRGEPCIVRGTYEAGSYTLSYAHLETPGSAEANALLAQLLGVKTATVPQWNVTQEKPLWTDALFAAMHQALTGLIRFGQSHFLLCWRTPWLLGWRRGVPGSPLTFLLGLLWQARHTPPTDAALAHWQEYGPRAAACCAEFCARTRDYLLAERRILATAPSSPESSASPALQRRKVELFGRFPGYGGMYGDILRVLDETLWRQLR